jgi:outer membrane protein
MKILSIIITVMTLASAVAAQAEPGDLLLRIGATTIEPKSNNGNLKGTQIGLDVESATSLTFDITYMFNEHIGIELLAAWPFEHDIDLDGAGNIGETKHLPPTLSLQYHWTRWGKFQPYVGAGINVTYFFDEDTKGALEGSDLDLDTSVGFAGQLGVDYQLSDKWFLNANVRYMNIETDADLDGTKVAEVKIDPWLYGINVGYRF